MGLKRAATVVLGVIAAIAAAVPAADAAVPRSFYGVTPQTDLYPEDFKDMGKGKVGTLRVEMSWSDIEPPPSTIDEVFGNRPYRWNEFDPQVNQAARRGIGILPTVYGTPYWLAQLQGCQTLCHKLGPNSTAGYVAFSLFMTAAVERYGPHGDFWNAHPKLPYQPIRAWQIWNEQNSSDYWKPEPNVGDYANLLIAGGEAVHEADPGATVITGGMIGEPAAEGKKTVSGWDFLKALLAYRPSRGALDAIAVHPYGASMYSVKRVLWRWRQELRHDGAPNLPIWVTEIGWASGGEEHPLNKGPIGQARLIGQALQFFTEKRDSLNIENVDIYAWRDAAPGDPNQCSWCARSGLLKYAGRQPKPAWRTYTSFTGGR